MTTEKLERRLTAILALDIAGYSRMMGRDEEGTLGRLNHIRRSIIDSTISRHDGSIVKTTGDGVLAEFKSARDAIVAAREIQDLLHSYNDGQPAAQRMDARIGVNIGDVIHHDGDVFGDGVNIAARLEAEAPAGGICISGRALDDLRKLAFAFEDRGEVLLKNIENPVRVLCVPPPQSESAEPAAAALPPPDPRARAQVEVAGAAPARTPARQGLGPWIAAALVAIAAIILTVVLINPRSPDPARLRAREAIAARRDAANAANPAAMPPDAAPLPRRRRLVP
ncbi:MAG: adenylate/guanylate cyclase domain-containing protein [Phenylobacterium sp.]